MRQVVREFRSAIYELGINHCSANKKSHVMPLHRHDVTSILKRDYPCPVLPVKGSPFIYRLFEFWREIKAQEFLSFSKNLLMKARTHWTAFSLMT